MTEFDQLQKIWKSQKPAYQLPGAETLRNKKQTSKDRLLRQLTLSALTFVLVACITSALQDLSLTFTGHLALAGLAVLCLMQASVQGYSALALYRIDELQHPAQHVKAWENYYHVRKKMIATSGPIYFIFFNLLMGLFFADTLAGYNSSTIAVIIILYISWIILAWFIIRRKIQAREYDRIQSAIDNLKKLDRDFNN
ncbi:MAG: hypothetical protein DI538_07735 [Azospira oryzae]|jgi:hypothetical protein|nr:MAG: hypothetical protein DI538_07735 [Azospira oryzae]